VGGPHFLLPLLCSSLVPSLLPPPAKDAPAHGCRHRLSVWGGKVGVKEGWGGRKGGREGGRERGGRDGWMSVLCVFLIWLKRRKILQFLDVSEFREHEFE